VAPVFGLVLLGYLAARRFGFDQAATRGLSLFVFSYAIPICSCARWPMSSCQPSPSGA
jgi:predicted permease